LSLKFTKHSLTAGLCPDPLGELKRSPRSPSRRRDLLLMEREEEKEGGRKGGREEKKKREKKGERDREGRGWCPPHMTCLHDAPEYTRKTIRGPQQQQVDHRQYDYIPCISRWTESCRVRLCHTVL